MLLLQDRHVLHLIPRWVADLHLLAAACLNRLFQSFEDIYPFLHCLPNPYHRHAERTDPKAGTKKAQDGGGCARQADSSDRSRRRARSTPGGSIWSPPGPNRAAQRTPPAPSSRDVQHSGPAGWRGRVGGAASMGPNLWIERGMAVWAARPGSQGIFPDCRGPDQGLGRDLVVGRAARG